MGRYGSLDHPGLTKRGFLLGLVMLARRRLAAHPAWYRPANRRLLLDVDDDR